ncbi:MAG TPA: hypothetical protein PKL41_15195, partial [Flavobacteriales bacterium]|nr:hypothetical protein [Flavobacteriales bacterium]
REDVNRNRMVKKTGSANDRDPALVNMESTTQNNVRVEQLSLTCRERANDGPGMFGAVRVGGPTTWGHRRMAVRT